MGLAQVYRHNTVPFDVKRRENVAEHSYGLATLACSIATNMNETLEQPLHVGEVAQMSLVHDLPEVLMHHGDISVYSDASLLEAKAADEEQARRQLAVKTQAFPWIASTIQKYEEQIIPEARFVYALDKIVVHIIVLISDHHHAQPTLEQYVKTEAVARQKISASFPALLPYFEDLSDLLKARSHFFTEQK